MEFLITLGLLGLLSVAVCRLFKAKAKATVIITVIVLISYTGVIVVTGDSRSLFSTFWIWVTTVFENVKEALGFGTEVANT